MRVTVICGGDSSERTVSLESGRCVAEALREAGHSVRMLAVNEAILEADTLDALHFVDAVFLALHGGKGEDGTLQAQLEAAGIWHYTGSGPMASQRAMQKDEAKRLVRAAGVPTADFAVWYPYAPPPPITFPCFIKPLSGGSGIDMRLVETQQQYENFVPTQPMLIEAYLSGREFTVGILDGKPLPVVEIKPISGLNDYHSKYTAGACEEICPAPISRQEKEHLQASAMRAFKALGLRDYARLDFRADAAGVLCFLEANTLPGMTKNSLLPLAAAVDGIERGALCEAMCRMAMARRTLDK